MKDACLEFLLQYLPSMPIPPIDGEENGLEYSVSNLNLNRFKLKKEDVHLTLGDFSVLNQAADAARAAEPTIEELGDDVSAGGSSAATSSVAAVAAPPGRDVPLQPPPPPQGPLPPLPPPSPRESTASSGGEVEGAPPSAPPNSTLLTVQADNISAEFVDLRWSYKQQYFPYLEGGGTCDAKVSGCRIALAFDLRRDFRRKRTDESDQSATAAKSGSSSGGSSSEGGVVALPSGSKRPNSTTGSEGGGVLAALLEAAHVPDEFSGAVLDLTGGSSSGSSGGDSGGSGGGGKGQGPSLIWEPVLVLGKCDVQIDDLTVLIPRRLFCTLLFFLRFITFAALKRLYLV
jgi:hypothetical protein